MIPTLCDNETLMLFERKLPHDNFRSETLVTYGEDKCFVNCSAPSSTHLSLNSSFLTAPLQSRQDPVDLWWSDPMVDMHLLQKVNHQGVMNIVRHCRGEF